MASRLFSLITISVLLLFASHAAAEGLAGHWEGAIEKGGERRPLALDLVNSGGKLDGTISMSQSGFLWREPLKIQSDGTKLRIEYGDPKSPAVLDGANDAGAIRGTFTIPPDFSAPFELKRADAQRPYAREEVTFHNGDIKLAGELFLPPSDKPLPAVIVMHGSGDNPRWSYYYNADFFARLGFASLVFDKRGNGDSTGNWREVGFWELAADGAAAAKYLATRKEIDAKRIGMFGISQAGWIMPMAASKSRDIAFVIAVSGGPITYEREGRWDVEYWFPKKGYSQADIDEALAYLKLDAEVTRTGEGYDKLRAMYAEIKQRPWYKDAPSRFLVPIPPKAKARDFDRKSIDIDHVSIVSSLEIPVLWIYGEDDASMPGPETAALVRQICQDSNKDFTVITFPAADHGIRVAPPEGAAFPFRRHAEGFYPTMTDWLRKKILDTE
jgi:pimeloyl-ACP methyl ester carboxylesterase